ncbi:MAG: hypothetical protein M3300_08330 [Actinomycetota bacterium]|nr:hypothetical protein [Actinomycetota bacterium]
MAASTNAKSTLSHALAKPITTVITDALPRATKGSHHGSAVVPGRLSVTFSTSDLLESELRRVDQRSQHGITVVGLVSVPKAATGRRPPP